jgi:DNA-directed RNA polymerase subunit K/omega
MDDSKILTYSDYDEEDEIDNAEPKYHSIKDVITNYDTIKTENKTKNILTKFERAKIIGMRAEQISQGAKPLTDVSGMVNVIQMAEKELTELKTPFIIRRKVSNKYEYWKIEDLIIEL